MEEGFEAGGGGPVRTLIIGVSGMWFDGWALCGVEAGRVAVGQGWLRLRSKVRRGAASSGRRSSGARRAARDVMSEGAGEGAAGERGRDDGVCGEDTGLAGGPHVKRRLVTREEVTKYLMKTFDEDESSKRLQRSEIVLKKFGLLNRDFQPAAVSAEPADGADCRVLRRQDEDGEPAELD